MNEYPDLVKIGYSHLIEQYELQVLPHYCISYLTNAGRGLTHTEQNQTIQIFPKSYACRDLNDPLLHLEFAIKYEGINLEIIASCFLNISAETVTSFVKKTPTGKYSRIIWFLYEFIKEHPLELPDIKNVPYVNLLDPKKYYVGEVERSKRHAINNNLLGSKGYCPFVRRTETLKAYENKKLSNKAEDLISKVDPAVLARATNYLYTKETKSSFGIENVKPDIKRTTKFIELLEAASTIPQLNKSLLIKLQNNIVDDTYKDKNYRRTQNYVGELTNMFMQKIHYISPKPSDIEMLMTDFLLCENKLFNSGIDPVIIAAILSFSFVLLHPFEDGNGRIHRFLIHYVLSKTNYTPNNIVFPVSAVMLKNLRAYDETLEAFSKPLLKTIGQYDLSDAGELSVLHETKHHYQYIDFTQFAEYLFSCIELTIQEDFQEELDFIMKYDRTKLAIQQIIDMPDVKIDRIIRCVAQNNGILGKKMRQTYFSELSDKTINDVQKVINKHMRIEA